MTDLKNGTYIGKARGFKSLIELKAKIQDEKITKIDLLKSNETPEIGEKSLPKLLLKTKKSGKFNVDAVSGATHTSEGFNNALKNIYQQASGQVKRVLNNDNLKNGTYKLQIHSYRNLGIYEGNTQTNLEVTFENNKIKSIKVPKYSDTPVIGGMAFKILSQKIIDNQSTNVDVVSGASISSNALIKGVEKAISEAGGNPEVFKARQIKRPKPQNKHLSADLVVIGSGMAGFSCAIQAAQQGAKVILVNKGQTFGNSSSKAGGFVMGAATKEQEKRNIKDTPQHFYEDLMTVYRDEKNVRPSMLKILADESASFIQFLSDLGLEWSDVVNVAPKEPRLTRRAHKIKGMGTALMHVFEKAAQKYHIDLRMGTTVNELIIDNNVIYGVRVEDLDGNKITIKSKTVAICGGSYTGKPELIKKYNPSMTNLEIVTGNGDGSAFKLFDQAKANIIEVPYPQLMYGFYGAGWTSYPEKIPESPVMANYDILSVDGSGKRVVSEDQFAFTFAKYVWRNGYDEGYSIFGKKVAQMYPNMTKLGLETKTRHGKPFGYKANTIEELAKDVGINPTQLKKTVTRYNELCLKHHDDDFGKDPKHLILIEAPYYIIRLPQEITDGYTGAEINENAQVIGKNGKIISGLYAAGACADAEVMGIDYYGDGMSLLNCGVFGRRAAKDICKKLNK